MNTRILPHVVMASHSPNFVGINDKNGAGRTVKAKSRYLPPLLGSAGLRQIQRHPVSRHLAVRSMAVVKLGYSSAGKGHLPLRLLGSANFC